MYTSNQTRLLLAEDDPLLREALTDYFTAKGIELDAVSDGLKALSSMKKQKYDLLLLDVMMPGLNGFQVCKELRSNPGDYLSDQIPIIFLTAKVMEEDTLLGYSLGADDYITKPFSLPILNAKIQAILGRTKSGDKLIAGDISINETTRQVFLAGNLLPLAPLEYEILLFLMKHPEQIFTRDQLLIHFWGYDFDGTDRVVDNHIKKLRKALGNSGNHIQTARKSGYWFSKNPG